MGSSTNVIAPPSSQVYRAPLIESRGSKRSVFILPSSRRCPMNAPSGNSSSIRSPQVRNRAWWQSRFAFVVATTLTFTIASVITGRADQEFAEPSVHKDGALNRVAQLIDVLVTGGQHEVDVLRVVRVDQGQPLTVLPYTDALLEAPVETLAGGTRSRTVLVVVAVVVGIVAAGFGGEG